MDFKDRVKQLRIEKGLSQKELAERAGYSGKSAISLIESGKRDVTLESAKRIADALGTTAAYLIGHDSDEHTRLQQERIMKYIEALTALNPTKDEIDEAVKYIEFQRIKNSQK